MNIKSKIKGTMNLLLFSFAMGTLLSYTIIGIVALFLMSPPDYKFYWVETNNYIRIMEIICGIYAVCYLVFLMDSIRKYKMIE